MNRNIFLLGLLLVSSNCAAFDNNYFIGLDVGHVNATINDSHTVSDGKFKGDNLESALFAGVHFDNDLILQSAYLANDSFDIFELGDNYNINQLQVLAGYSLAINDRFRFVPKAGLSFWELFGEEGQLLNPGDELKQKYSGNDFVWSLALEMSVSKSIALEVVYSDNQYDFGQSQTTSLGIKMEF